MRERRIAHRCDGLVGLALVSARSELRERLARLVGEADGARHHDVGRAEDLERPEDAERIADIGLDHLDARKVVARGEAQHLDLVAGFARGGDRCGDERARPREQR